jgi:hypothetical protein
VTLESGETAVDVARAALNVRRVDRIDRLGLGIDIARRSRQIAIKNVVAGVRLGMLGQAWVA